MGELDRAHCTAIEPDFQEPEVKGYAYINIKNVPNGHYSLYFIRIG